MALRVDDISINTIIGKGSAISGNLKVNGFIRIDGDIDGNLETDGNVIVGELARIRGNLTAKAVIIGGIVAIVAFGFIQYSDRANFIGAKNNLLWGGLGIAAGIGVFALLNVFAYRPQRIPIQFFILPLF